MKGKCAKGGMKERKKEIKNEGKTKEGNKESKEKNE